MLRVNLIPSTSIERNPCNGKKKNIRSLALSLQAGFILLFRLGFLLFDDSITTSLFYTALHRKIGKRRRKGVVDFFKKKVYITI
jgi:hypothetical protein